MAKLWICDKLFTLIRLGDADTESAGDRKERAGDCEGGSPDGCTGRAFAKPPGVGFVPGVGCCECGRHCGLGGVGARCWEGVWVWLGSEESCCCDRWTGVELDGGAPESAIGTSAGGGATRGEGLTLAAVDGRTGV